MGFAITILWFCFLFLYYHAISLLDHCVLLLLLITQVIIYILVALFYSGPHSSAAVLYGILNLCVRVLLICVWPVSFVPPSFPCLERREKIESFSPFLRSCGKREWEVSFWGSQEVSTLKFWGYPCSYSLVPTVLLLLVYCFCYWHTVLPPFIAMFIVLVVVHVPISCGLPWLGRAGTYYWIVGLLLWFPGIAKTNVMLSKFPITWLSAQMSTHVHPFTVAVAEAAAHGSLLHTVTGGHGSLLSLFYTCSCCCYCSLLHRQSRSAAAQCYCAMLMSDYNVLHTCYCSIHVLHNACYCTQPLLLDVKHTTNLAVQIQASDKAVTLLLLHLYMTLFCDCLFHWLCICYAIAPYIATGFRNSCSYPLLGDQLCYFVCFSSFSQDGLETLSISFQPSFTSVIPLPMLPMGHPLFPFRFLFFSVVLPGVCPL